MQINISNLTTKEVNHILRNLPIKYLPKLYIEVKGDEWLKIMLKTEEGEI
jgi:predicted transcriptional regulator